MSIIIEKIEVGPWPMNSYLLICEGTNECAAIDPGADYEKILACASGAAIKKILITHGHADHVGNLEQLVKETGAEVHIHPLDADKFDLEFDCALEDGVDIPIGDYSIRVIHTPGHTPGICCFDLGDGRVVVGDTVFVGGPGKTWSADEFNTQMKTMETIVFSWTDETAFFPGHGPSGVIGEERPAFSKFVANGWDPALVGDVSWE